MATSATDIATAFTNGSGMSAGGLAIVIGVAVMGIMFVFSISVLFKRLNMFQKDQDGHELWRATGLIVLAIAMISLFTSAIVGW